MILALLLAASAGARAAGPEDLGRALAASAARAGVARVAVQPFAGPPAVGRDAAEAVLRGLVSSGRVRVVERMGLPAVLAERRLAAAGLVSSESAFPRLAAGDAVVVGRAYRSRAGWTIAVRLVSSATGEVVAGGGADLAGEEAPPPAPAEGFPPLAALIDAGHALAETRDAGALERLANSSDSPAPERAAAVLALAEAGDGEFALADALRDPDAVVRFAGAMALGRAAAPWAEGPLRNMLKADPSWPARFAAAQALSRYASSMTTADLAAARESDASWRVRRQAADSLAGRREALP